MASAGGLKEWYAREKRWANAVAVLVVLGVIAGIVLKLVLPDSGLDLEAIQVVFDNDRFIYDTKKLSTPEGEFLKSFGGRYREIHVTGFVLDGVERTLEEVQIICFFEYQNTEKAASDAQQKLTGQNADSTPYHRYVKGRTIALYIGDDRDILYELDAIFGGEYTKDLS